MVSPSGNRESLGIEKTKFRLQPKPAAAKSLSLASLKPVLLEFS
jgi:hypothetical protein